MGASAYTGKQDFEVDMNQMYQHILAAIDVSVPALSQRLLQKSLLHLQYSSAKLTLLSVAPAKADDMAQSMLSSELSRLVTLHLGEFQDRVSIEIRHGLPSAEVIAASERLHCDLVLIGRHRGGPSQLGRATLGSTAAKIATQVSCDLCIVRSDDVEG